MSPSLQPLTLHAHSTGPNPYKAAILLESLALPYSVKLWDFGDAKNGVKGAVFTQINENGRVPAVEDPNTGVVSWESGAVLGYLLRVYDKEGKFGPGANASEQDRVDFDKWICFLLTSLGPMIGQVNWYRHYNAISNPDALKRYEEQSHRCFGVLEGQLKKSGGKSVLEKGYSAVDMHFYPWVFQHTYAQLSLDEYPTVKKWLATIGARPEVRKAYEAIPNGENASA